MCTGRSLLIFSNVIFKILPGGHIGFFLTSPNFSSTWPVYMKKSLMIFRYVTFKMAAWWPYWIFWFLDSKTSVWLWIWHPNFRRTLLVCMERRLLIFRDITFKMTVCQPYWIFMPPPLGAGAIMFSGCPSLRPCEAWNTLFWPVHGSVGPPDQPLPFYCMSVGPSVRPSLRPSVPRGFRAFAGEG